MCHTLCVIIHQLFTTQLELLNLLQRQFYKFRELQQTSYAIPKKGDIYGSDTRGTVRLDYCNLHIMTAKYFLDSKSSFLIFLGYKASCFTVPLILLLSLVHFGLLFPFSLSNPFKYPFLHKACMPWSYFHSLFFVLFFHFLYLHTHHSLSLIPIPVFLLQLFNQSLPELHINKSGATSLFLWIFLYPPWLPDPASFLTPST